MKTITINTIKSDDFTRVNNTFDGNPCYVLHFLQVSDNYTIACDMMKGLGNRHHNKQYGGGIKFNCIYNKENLIYNIQQSIVEYHNKYALYLIDCFDNQEGEYPDRYVIDIVSSIKTKFLREKKYQYSLKDCENYLRGLSGFNHAYDPETIEKLGKGRFKDIRKNANYKKVQRYVEYEYWENLAEGLYALLLAEIIK